MAKPQPDKFTRISNELLEAFYRAPFMGRRARVVLWVIRNSYGWGRKWAYVVGPRELAREIKMAHPHIINAIRWLIEEGILKKDGDRFYLIKDYEGWYQKSTGTDSVPEAVPKEYQRGTDSVPRINKVVKESFKEIKENTAKYAVGGDINLLISEFGLMLNQKMGETVLFNRGAAAKVFKKLLTYFQRHDIQSRFNHWFSSTDDFITRNCFRVEQFFYFFPRLKSGPIMRRETKSETPEDRNQRVLLEAKKRREHNERVSKFIAGK